VLSTHRRRPPVAYGGWNTKTLSTPGLIAQAVKRAQQGDRQALGFLYARYADNVHGYVRSIVHDEYEAEDLTQHVFAKLIVVIGSYEEREVPFFAWILRVSRNVAVDHLRRRRAIPVDEVRAIEEGAAGAASAGSRVRGISDSERISDLREALSTLPTDQREVLVLRHFAGLSPTEIAAHTGRTESSVHGLHHRGRRTLAAELTSRGAAPATSRRGWRAPRPACAAAGAPATRAGARDRGA